MALSLIEDDVVPHQFQHLELVSNVKWLLWLAPICNRQADQTATSTNLESALCPPISTHTRIQTARLEHAAYSTAGGILHKHLGRYICMYPLVKSM